MADKANKPKTTFELIVELINGIAWPLFAFVLLIGLWGPLQSVATQFPDIIGRSETITIAGLSIKVGQGLKQQASGDVEKVLSNLSPDGLRKLIDNGNESYWDYGSETYAKNEVAELVRMKLLEEISGNELRGKDKKYAYGVRPTILGKNAREYVLKLISQFVGELKRSK